MTDHPTILALDASSTTIGYCVYDGSVWDTVRNLDALRVQLAARPKKTVKVGKRKVVLPDVPIVAEPEQMELFAV